MPSSSQAKDTEPRTDHATVPTMPFSNEAASTGAKGPLPEFIGRHRVCQQLGEGTFGTVYRCYDEQLRRNVAIKLPHSAGAPSAERLKAFMHEAQSAARLKHPGIVTALDIGQTDDGRGFIVYEYIDGDTLRQHIQRRDYTVDQAVRWTIELAQALHYAHKQGLVHRDIKPANVLVDRSGKAHLTDFGLAKLDDHYFTDDAGRVLGTVAYMSPEQARGQSHWASAQSDVYSLGVLFFQLLTGRLPFSAESTLALLEQVEYRDPPPPRTIDDTIPRELEAICLKAMAKKASDRYTTAADMANDLSGTLVGETRPSRAWTIGVPVAALLLLGAGTFLIKSQAERGGSAAPTAMTNVATVNAPTLSIVLQKKFESEGEHKTLEANDLPLRDGDRVQFHAQLPKPGYAYIYWYNPEGEPKRLFPEPQEKLDQVKPSSDIWSPASAQAGDQANWWPVEGRKGTEVALLAISDKPLSAEELAEFEDNHLQLTGKVSRNSGLIEIGTPAPGRTTRDLGMPVKSAKTGLPSDFQHKLKDTFRAYHGWAVTHE